MALSLDRESLLAVAERSPRAAAAHDRAGWVGLFTADGAVEDPVGSRPHVGHAEIGRFYDTFIAPRDITLHRDLDIVFGASVLRDLELEVAMGSAVTMRIPAFLRYDLREVNGQWRIAKLRAYWELPAMMLQFLRTGLHAVAPAAQLTSDLLRNQGIRGTAGFAKGFRRAGAQHQKLVQTFLGAVARHDRLSALRALSSTAAITLADNSPLELGELVERLDGVTPTKSIGAGPIVTVSLNSDHGRGILFADVARRKNVITQIRYFPA